MNSALYWAVCFGNTNPTDRTQIYSENAPTVCIPVHNTRRMYKQEQSSSVLTHSVQIWQERSSQIWRSDFPLESLAPATAHTPLSLFTCFQHEKGKQGVSFRSGIWNHSFSWSQCVMVLLHHACLSSSMDPLTFCLCCELPPLCLCLSLSHS